MAEADLALLGTAASMLALRAAGLAVAGVLGPRHWLVQWAAAVSQATLAGFVALAVRAPGGALLAVPLLARLSGLAAGLLAWAALRGRLLPALLAGLAALVLVRAVLG